MIQLSLKFHGGVEIVAYEWGAPTYLNYDSIAQYDGIFIDGLKFHRTTWKNE
jgi:hypothetical protein